MESFGGKYFFFQCGLNGRHLVPLCHALQRPLLCSLKTGRQGRLRPASRPPLRRQTPPWCGRALRTLPVSSVHAGSSRRAKPALALDTTPGRVTAVQAAGISRLSRPARSPPNAGPCPWPPHGTRGPSCPAADQHGFRWRRLPSPPFSAPRPAVLPAVAPRFPSGFPDLLDPSPPGRGATCW